MRETNFFHNTLTRLKEDQRVRYLVFGAFNTFIGYLISNILYYTLSKYLHVVIITTIAVILAVSIAFFSYKKFVFRTKGNWLREYLRCWAVYSIGSLFAILAMWWLVDGLLLPFWLAQGIVIAIIVVVSYFGHSRFSFAQKK
ncbi:MAG: GtrA family protein [Endomicrobium sp.]|nr:GtrA family protein [Endomicrobium sp.]